MLTLTEAKAPIPGASPHPRKPYTKPAGSLRKTLSKNEGITKVSENKYIIDQRLYESLTKDVSSLMTLQRQISFIPKMDADRNPIGFEVRRITPGSLFQKIGLRRGDVVKSVNGKVLNAMSVQGALQLLTDMRKETDISLDIKRRNREETIGYEVR